MATSRQQSAAPNDANPHRPGPGGPGSRSTTNDSMLVFGNLFDDPSPGGAGLSGQLPERPDKPSSDPPQQPAVNMAGLPTPQPKRSDSGSTATPVINQWLNSSIPTHPPAHQQQRNAGPQVPTSKKSLHNIEAPPLPNPKGGTNPAGFMGLARDHISTAVGNKESTDVGGGAPVHPSASRGAPTRSQSLHQSHSQNEPHANVDPPKVPLQAKHETVAKGIRSSSTNNPAIQMQDSSRSSASTVNIERPILASVPSRDNGQEDRNVGMPNHVTPMKPPQPPHKTNLDSPRQPAVNKAGLPTSQPKVFGSGSTPTPVITQGLNSSNPPHPPAHQQQRNAGPQVPTSKNSLHSTGASWLPNTTGDTNPAGFTSIAKQDHISTAAGNKERTDVGGGAPVHPPTSRGGSTNAQSLHRAQRQTEPRADTNPPGVPSQPKHGPIANDGVKSSSTNNQAIQIGKSAPSDAPIVPAIPVLDARREEAFNVGRDDGNVGMPDRVTPMKPHQPPHKTDPDPPRQSAVNKAGLPTSQPKGFDSGSTPTPVITQGPGSSNPPHPPAHQQQRNAGPQVPTSKSSLPSAGAPPLPNTTGDTSPAGFTSLAQQSHISTVAGSNKSTEAGGGHSAPVHPSAGRGAPSSAQSPHQAHSQTEPHAKGSPPQPPQPPAPKPDSPAARKPSIQAIARPKVSEPGSDTRAKVYPPGNDTAKVLGHGQSDSKDGAPSAKIPNNFADDGGSEGGSGRIAQVSKELVINHDRQIPHDPRPDTTPSGASETFRKAANMVIKERRVPTTRGSGDGNRNNPSTINDVESLKKGEIKTSKNETNAPYTILLVGEIGVGKSSVLELIENVLAGKAFDHYNFKNHTNQDRGSTDRSRTDQAHLYTYTSTNGMVIRILDTPGLADIRGIQQDKHHMESIASQIKCIDSITAVLVLADGSASDITVGTGYAFSTLSTIFPKSLASNIAFMFTNVSNPPMSSLSGAIVSDVLRDAPQFYFNNPIALKKDSLKLRDDSKRIDLKASEQKTLEMLVNFFNWLDSLEPQPVTESVSLYDKSRAIDTRIVDILAKKDQADIIQTKINEQTTKLRSLAPGASSNTPVWRKHPTSKPNYSCDECRSNCGGSGFMAWFRRVFKRPCKTCGHAHSSHTHTPDEWVQEKPAQTLVDKEAANNEKVDIESFITARNQELGQLKGSTKQAMDDLAQRTEPYAALSLSGRFSVHMEKAVQLLEQRYTDAKKERVRKEMQDSLGVIRRKLELLREVEGKMHRDV